MWRRVRKWIASCASGFVRGRIPRCLGVSLRNSAGNLSLSMSSLDHDWEYATRRLVHLLNELYVDVLARPRYFDWLIENFELDPDDPRWP